MAAPDATGRVLEVRPLPLRHFLLRIRVDGMEPAAPGQFVMVAGADQAEPYLRRAFSVYGQEPGREGTLVISLLGKVIGRGTAALAAGTAGEDVPVLGPLGRGFHTMAPASAPDDRSALVAGGIGSAGLGLLAQALARAGRPFDFYYGGRGAGDLVEADEFRRLSERTGGRLVETTEDGAAGIRGLVTEALLETIENGKARSAPAYSAIYTCGPHGLMAAVARIAADHGIEGQAALETPMGCGYGACLGCAVELTKGGYALCCRHGPVFDLEEVVW